MNSGRTVVDGRFELLEPLGSGGMGTVWRAYDLALHREVALKEVRAVEGEGSGSSAEVQRERVLREARALARIGHPNVVTVHHIVDSPPPAHPWIVMELVRGRTLSDHLAAGPLAPAEAAQIGRGILAALRAAHSVGVLHRDIKPANVILREDGTPVLTDFGIAAIDGLNGLTATGNLVGSLDYVAPERLSGQEGNPASDLWSLGLVLYVAVEGFHPMRRETSVATLAAVLKGDVPPPQRAAALTPALQALLLPEPNQRATAEQVDQLLAHAIAPAGAVTAPPTQFRPPFSATPLPSRTTAQVPTTYASPPRAYGAPVATHQPPRPRRRWLIISSVVAAAIAATVVIAIALRPDSAASQAIPSQTTTPGHPPPGLDLPSTDPTPTTSKGTNSVDLLSPDGIRQAIAALETISGSNEFTEATFYPEFANVSASVKGKKVYDLFTYRDGAASRTGPGGTLTKAETVKLGSINWDVIPELFRTADQHLGIPVPTMRYLIIEPAWTFNDQKPTILVYLTDEYGGAYLAANLDGSIVKMYARER